MQNGQVPTPFNNPFVRFISDNRYRWLRHGLFILLGLVLAFKGDIGSPDNFPSIRARNTVLVIDAVTLLFILGILYLLLYVVVPKLLFRSKHLWFIVSFFMLIVLIYFVIHLLDRYYIHPLHIAGMQAIELSPLHFIQMAAMCTVLLGSVVGLTVLKKWIADVKRMNELHEINLKTELEQLKSQVNPHFLFNTLNSLVVLTQTDPQKASQVLFGLSDLLRYQLYDSAREEILLAKDIEFIRNLLSLEKLRKNDFEYTIDIEGAINGIKVPPFLFIPFIENGIKHGASTIGHSYLRIHFHITRSQIFFSSENSKPLVKTNRIGGLGLKNIKRRLELLYPQNHTLSITDETDKYSVHLILPL